MSRPNIPRQDSELQTRFNQRGFLAGRNMKEDAYPTMDVSLTWPLQPQLNHLRIVLPPTGYFTMERPNPGRHMIITRASWRVSAPTSGDVVRLILRRSSLGNVIDGNGDILLATFEGTNGSILPIIGGQATLNSVQFFGIAPVYVPSGLELGFAAHSAAGDTGDLTWVTAEFPDTQPLTSLLAGF